MPSIFFFTMVVHTRYGRELDEAGELVEEDDISEVNSAHLIAYSETDEDGDYIINTGPLNQVTIIILLQNPDNIAREIGQLPKVFWADDVKRIRSFGQFCHHIVIYIPELTQDIIGQLKNILPNHKLLAIDFEGKNPLMPNDIFKLDLSGKSNNYIIEYLKILLRA